MKSAISSAWDCRVSSWYAIWCDGDESPRMYALMVLRCLLLNVDALTLRHGDRTSKTFLASCHRRMVPTFGSPVMSPMNEGSSLPTFNRRVRWDSDHTKNANNFII